MLANLSRESKVLSLSASLHFLTHMFMLIFPALVLPCAREFHVSPSHVISLGFPMYFLYGALALPAGYLADRWSKTAILKICAAGMTFSTLLAGASTTIGGYAAALALLGFFCALYHPAGLGFIAQEIGKQGRAHGINGIFGNMGIGMAPLVAGITLMTAPWRYVYFFCAALGLAWLVAAYLLQVKPINLDHSIKKTSGESPAHNARYFAILLAAMTMAGLIYRANSVALPTLIETSGGGFLKNIIQATAQRLGENAGSGASAIIVSSLFIFSVLGQAAGGKLADRIDLRHGYIFFHAVAAIFIAAVGWLSGFWLYLAAAGMVFFNLGMQPIENSLVSKFIPGRWISTGYGIKFTFTFGVGSLAVGQVAWFEKNVGLKSLYPIMAAEAALAAGLAILLLYASRGIKEVRNVHQVSDNGATTPSPLIPPN
ncbi:MAG: MFS transporter [Nitrospinota bacterium]|nr:MFS transporter [Nitrospinota bacterium]